MGFDPITLALAQNNVMSTLLASQSRIIVETELEPFDPNGPNPTQISVPEMLVEGESYTVKIASGVYTSVCKKIMLDGMVAGYIGSPKLLGGEDTGEPFCFATADVVAAITALCFDFNGGTTMTVSQETKTIDPKYLPPSQPKVIDLDSYGIGQVIVGLFANGGGTHSMQTNEQFWADISTDSELRLEQADGPFRFVVDHGVSMKGGNGPVQLSYNFLVMDETGALHNIAVCIGRNGDNIIVNVKVA